MLARRLVVCADSELWQTHSPCCRLRSRDHMIVARYASLVAALLAAGPAVAEPLDADAARRFVVGKQFAFTCFDGTRGAGRIFADGSVMGTIQVRGSGPARSVWLPAETLRVKGDTVCGSLRGIPIEPCFDLDKT